MNNANIVIFGMDLIFGDFRLGVDLLHQAGGEVLATRHVVDEEEAAGHEDLNAVFFEFVLPFPAVHALKHEAVVQRDGDLRAALGGVGADGGEGQGGQKEGGGGRERRPGCAERRA